MVLEKCSNILSDGGENSIEEKRDELSKLIDDYASEGNFFVGDEFTIVNHFKGLRTIALAYKDFSEEPGDEASDIIQDLTFIGIAGIKDPVRKEVPDAVEKCKKAGIIVRMITGDSIPLSFYCEFSLIEKTF